MNKDIERALDKLWVRFKKHYTKISTFKEMIAAGDNRGMRKSLERVFRGSVIATHPGALEYMLKKMRSEYPIK